MAEAGCALLVAGVPEALVEGIAAVGVGWPSGDIYPDTDHALERCEDDLLLAHLGREAGRVTGVELAQVDVLRSLAPDDVAVLAGFLETETYASGEVVLREGDDADRLCFLLSGSATVRLGLDGDTEPGSRLRTFGPGCVFGESAILDGGHRSATVVADEPLRIQTLSVDALRRLATTRPDIHAALFAGLGPYMSEMLTRALAEIRALDG